MNRFSILELKPQSHIHFIGIGGISMSALAQILKNIGFKVSGSDAKSSNITEKLSNNDIKVYIGHDSSNIKGADVIVHTAAIKNDNTELLKSKELNLPILERSELLGEIMRKYKYSIGVAGTHGKTTTTSMVSLILLEANLDPTITVGGELDPIGGNLRLGNSEYFVTEACEYVESFLKFYPFVGTILNIDADHLDYYKDINNITDSFYEYAKLIPLDGYLIANNDDSRVINIAANVECNVISYSINDESSTYRAVNIEFDQKGCPEFSVLNNNCEIGNIKLNIPGIHNIYNALAAIACSMCLGVDFDSCKSALFKFSGAKRRFEHKGSFDQITVIDDYAHHPTEVKATLNAATKYPHDRIWCVFQPHTYTRTKKLLDEFSEAFEDADKIIIADIYAAREKDSGDIHSKDLVAKLKARGKDALYFSNFSSIKDYILNNAKQNDVVITMGAGDIYKVGEQLISDYHRSLKKQYISC